MNHLVKAFTNLVQIDDTADGSKQYLGQAFGENPYNIILRGETIEIYYPETPENEGQPRTEPDLILTVTKGHI